MNKFIYVNPWLIFLHDQQQYLKLSDKIKRYTHLTLATGAFFHPRKGPSYSPFPLADPVCAIPDPLTGSACFTQTMDSIMSQYADQLRKDQRKIYILWSGGIDSTAIMVGMLKNFDRELLERVTVLCNQASIAENPYFYYTFIHDQLHVEDSNSLVMTDDNIEKFYLFDGEAGNQCTGSALISECKYAGLHDILQQPLSSLSKLSTFFVDKLVKHAKEIFDTTVDGHHKDPQTVYAIMDYIHETAPLAPVGIDTVYDGLWWFNFNTKVEEVFFRKLPHYGRFLSAEKFKFAATNSIIRVYVHPEMQSWALLSLKDRFNKILTDTKYHPKKYIFDFDKNHHYFNNKMEVSSLMMDSAQAHIVGISTPIFGIDEDWNKYQLGNPDDRKVLGEILKGI